MSEMGDFFRQQREQKQKQNADRLKWNTEVVEFAAGEFDFKLVKKADTHFSLFHPQKGRLDYWPSTGKATWVRPKQKQQFFTITDIDQYLLKHFKS